VTTLIARRCWAFLSVVQCLSSCPGDLFLAKKVQLLCFVLGDRRGMLSVMRRSDVAAACTPRSYYGGMLAFALEENDQLDAARSAALRSLEIESRDPWAIHVMAHIFFAEAELDRGVEW
jgi:hypothetical protein